MIRTIVRQPLGWGAILAAALVAALIAFSYLGGFLDPTGNMRDVPLAVVNEDAGVTVNGQPLNLGAQVVQSLTAPNPRLGDDVAWRVLSSREAAMDRLDSNRDYATIIVPADYTARVLALSNPSGAPTTSATIEILTNPAAGSYAGPEAEAIATRAIASISSATSEQILTTLAASGLAIDPTSVPVLATPVQPAVTVAEPVGAQSGRGLAPFYLAVVVTLAGVIGANIVHISVDVLTGKTSLDILGRELSGPTLPLTRLGAWSIKLALTIVMAVLAGTLVTLTTVGILGMDATNPYGLAAFTILGITAVALVTLVFLTAFGIVGSLLVILVTTIFGVPSAGGVYPREMMPAFFRFLGEWLPLRYMTDANRALMFFDGQMSAGLATALWVISGYVLGAFLVSGLIAMAIDRRQHPASPRLERSRVPA